MVYSSSFPVICLMGPTASGKTPLAVRLVKEFPCEIISVDSVQVYQGLDIGSAKPTPEVLKVAPHRLISMLDPKEIYSAGQFRTQVLVEIEKVIARKKIPLLVGGTMLYFRVLQQGLAALPAANPTLRTWLRAEAAREGVGVLHARLAKLDPQAAARISASDAQRIQRALEVYLLTGKSISDWQSQHTKKQTQYHMYNLIVSCEDRTILHTRIAQRFEHMLQQGLIEEVMRLYQRGDLSSDLPALRAVGYRQVWQYLSGQLSYDDMCQKAIIATRQLAKRQLTWLRTWPNSVWFNSDKVDVFKQVNPFFRDLIQANLER